MNTLALVVTIAHIIFALALVVVVLMQESKQQGLSGSISGGADTFFGKNKGRTMDGLLKKATIALAVLFIVTSVALVLVSKTSTPPVDATPPVVTPAPEDGTDVTPTDVPATGAPEETNVPATQVPEE